MVRTIKPSANDMRESRLEDISLDRIDRNPENPRLVFRSGELDQLTESIRLYGVQVPIAVFREGRRYVLIDGERRWRCSLKLNRGTIPALVQGRPAPLLNLLLMFNIHALREQWDLLTIALKLPRVIALLRSELGEEPNERTLAARTGLARSSIRRSKLLLNLPERYRHMILEELSKPKRAQTVSEDLFIEMERSLNVVERHLPDLVVRRDTVRDVLIDKYRKGVIGNIVQFRQVAKIARADKVQVGAPVVRDVLSKLFAKNDYSIETAYRESAAEAYEERDLVTRMQALLDRLAEFEPEDIDERMRVQLRALIEKATALLEE